MPPWTLPNELTVLIATWAATLDARTAARVPLLLLGILFARGRRTVTSWLRAAGLGHDFQPYYYLVAALGRKSDRLAAWLFRLLLRRLQPEERWLFALDDTPTQRYGPHVQGAGVHHNPTPGPTDQKFLYGHIWVTLAWVVRHPWWGPIGLPLLAYLYVRQKDVGSIPRQAGWRFRTKLEQAADLIDWLAGVLRPADQPVWLAVDGFYSKAPVLKAARTAGVVVVGRLRKDAGLRSVPPVVAADQRRPGRPPTYGRQRLSLAKRAGHQQGWQTLEAELYGERVTKTLKTFQATWKPAGGAIRVVLVREEDGWVAFFCTDPQASAAAVLEAVAGRATIEQDFHDLKEVEGAGQQQVRDVWANVGAFNLNLWAHALVEWWAWGRPHEEICDRSASPWDDPTRRPSHADRRKALQRQSIEEEFIRVAGVVPVPEEIRVLLQALLGQVA